MRFDVHEVAREAAAPHCRPSRARAALVDAALWQATEFVAARIAAPIGDVWAELRWFTSMDEIWGPGSDAKPTDSLLLAVDDGRALRIHATDDPRCRFCSTPHRSAPADLCPSARDEYDGAGRWGDELGLNPFQFRPLTEPKTPPNAQGQPDGRSRT